MNESPELLLRTTPIRDYGANVHEHVLAPSSECPSTGLGCYRRRR